MHPGMSGIAMHSRGSSVTKVRVPMSRRPPPSERLVMKSMNLDTDADFMVATQNQPICNTMTAHRKMKKFCLSRTLEVVEQPEII